MRFYVLLEMSRGGPGSSPERGASTPDLIRGPAKPSSNRCRPGPRAGAGRQACQTDGSSGPSGPRVKPGERRFHPGLDPATAAKPSNNLTRPGPRAGAAPPLRQTLNKNGQTCAPCPMSSTSSPLAHTARFTLGARAIWQAALLPIARGFQRIRQSTTLTSSSGSKPMTHSPHPCCANGGSNVGVALGKRR